MRGEKSSYYSEASDEGVGWWLVAPLGGDLGVGSGDVY